MAALVSSGEIGAAALVSSGETRAVVGGEGRRWGEIGAAVGRDQGGGAGFLSARRRWGNLRERSNERKGVLGLCRLSHTWHADWTS